MANLQERSFQYKEVQINNFGGGITDRYVGQNLTKYKTADNLVISNVSRTTVPTLKLRAGYRGYCQDIAEATESPPDTSHYSLNLGYARLHAVNDDMFVAVNSDFHVLEDEISVEAETKDDIDSGDDTILVGTGHGFTENRICYVEGTILPGGLSLKTTYRIILDGTTKIKLYTYDIAAIEEAGTLVQLTANATNRTFKIVQKAYLKKIDKTQTGDPVFTKFGNNYPVSFSRRGPELLAVSRDPISTTADLERPVRVYNSSNADGSVTSHKVEGMEMPLCRTPLLSDGDTAWGSTDIATGTANVDRFYQYAIVFTRKYNIKTDNTVITKKSFGEIAYSKTYYFDEPSDNAVTITLPHVPTSYRTGQNPEDNLVLEVYRTVAGSSTFKFLVELTLASGNSGGFTHAPLNIVFGTTPVTFADTVADEDLGHELYTNGDAKNHINPPRCKYLTTVGDITYYGFIVENLLDPSGETEVRTDYVRPQRVIQSLPGGGGFTADDSFVDVDDMITGLGQAGSFPMIFTKSYIYRIEGMMDSFGIGAVRVKVVNDYAGCVSQESIVSTSTGVYWMGNDGFYFSDGYKTMNLSEDLNESFDKLVNTEKAVATYDKYNHLIHFGVCDNSEITLNNVIWTLNTKTLGFTKSKSTKADFDVVSLVEKRGAIYRSDGSGYIYKHHPDIKKDVERATTSPANDFTTWESIHINFNFLSIATDFQAPGTRKWVKDSTITIKSDTNLGVVPYSSNDDGAKIGDMKDIRELGTVLWGSETFVWGSPDISWRSPETISNVRRFPRSAMRCRRKQLGLKPARISVLRSDIYSGDALISVVQDEDDANLWALTFDPYKQDGVTANAVIWPSADFLYQAHLVFPATGNNYSATGDYTHNFTFKERISDRQITVTGSILTGLDTATYSRSWVLKVFQKDQEMELTNIVIRYAHLSNTGDAYQKEEDGVNE